MQKKQRNRQKFSEEMVKIPSEMLHPFLHSQAETENMQREMDIYFFPLNGMFQQKRLKF
jgi:hypothetical protein